MGLEERRARERRRSIVACLACGLPAAALALDSSVGLLRGWRPRREVEWVALSAVALLALVAGGAVLTGPGRRALGRAWLHVVLLAAAAVGAVIAVELLRPPGVPPGAFHLRPPGQRLLFDPDPRWVPGVVGAGALTTNRLGLRGPELPPGGAAYRILCVGGSTTECLYLDDGEAWTGLLPARLARAWGRRVWVGSAGMSGYSTAEHLPFLERWERLAAIDCVVLLAGVNDFALLALGGRDPVAPTWTAPAWTRTSAMRMFRDLHKQTRGAPLYQDPRGAWYEARREVRRYAPKVTGLPDLEPALAAYQARLEAIATTCERRGVELVLATQPVLWREGLDPRSEDLLWLGWSAERGSFYTAGALREGIDRFNRRLVEVAGSRGLRVVDLSGLSGDPRWFFDDCHFTEAGARRVADLFEAQLACPAELAKGP